ncbi:Leucine rich repeat-containing protein [Ruminococcus sp. YRD2003]|uniref:leucine-rich repeat protein n=1 Tax=Ruminococcus sp. YRD2003 TaxID=1452313 RepID=UPI0008CC48DB|nr:Leucine rich repeat-containing protein [Ruminococcus flavefaciens]
MNWRKILAVGTAMTAVGVFVPTPIVQKCASLVAYAIEYNDALEYGDFLYLKGSRLEEVEEDDGTSAYEEVEYIEIVDIKSNAKGDIVIPDEIDGLPVTDVLSGQWWGDKLSSEITSVTLPKYAKNVSLWRKPENCEVKVAEGNENLYIENGFLIQKNATYYDYNTYESKKGNILLEAVEPLKGEVTVPEGVVTGTFNFTGNSDITVINLPSTIKALGWYFCSNMPSLKAINVAEGNDTFFSYHGALGKYYYSSYDVNGEWHERVKAILAVPEGYEGVFSVPDGVELTFTGLSFENVSKMTGVELGKDTAFACGGFQGCKSLETIELNGRVTSISGIEKYRGGHWDSEKQDWVEDDYITSVEVAAHMFADTKWYQDHPDGMLCCGDTVIGYKGTPKGDKLDIREGTRTIVDKAFNGLDIGEVNIPASVEYIGAYSFDCPNLTAVNIDKDNPNYTSIDGVVYDKDMKWLKLYPQGKTDESYTVPDGVEVIAANACDGNKFIKHVNVPDSVSTIFGWGDSGGAFKNCMSLEDINVPSGSFNTGALYNDSLKVIDLSESVSSYSGDVDDCDCDYLIFRNPKCEIMGMNKVKCIVGLANSNAKAFAEEHFIPFMLLEDYEKEQATATTTTATTTTQTTTTTTATTTTATSTPSSASTTQTTTTTTTATTQPTTTTTTSSSALDSRFVGKWELYKYEVDGAYTSLKPDGFELFANGEGKWSSGGRILWTVVDEFLYIEANDGNLPININRYKYINGELLWSGWTQVVDDNIAPETEKYAMNFYGKSENIYFRRVEDSEQTTTATTTTSQHTTTTTASTTQSTTTTQTTTAQTTTEPVTTTATGTNPDKPDMSAFIGSWISYKASVNGIASDISEDEAIQLVIAGDKSGRISKLGKAGDITWDVKDNGKLVLMADGEGTDIAYDGSDILYYESEGRAIYFKRGEKPVEFGDPNSDGKVDANDASFVLVQYSKLSTGGEAALTDAEKSAADINKDGKLDSKDASFILAYYSYLSTGGTDKFDKYLEDKKA